MITCYNFLNKSSGSKRQNHSFQKCQFPNFTFYWVMMLTMIIATECCNFHRGKVSYSEEQIYIFTDSIPITCAFKWTINLTTEKILRFIIWLHHLRYFVKTLGPYLKKNSFKKYTYFLQENKKKITPLSITFPSLKKKIPSFENMGSLMLSCPCKSPVQLPIITQLWITPWTQIEGLKHFLHPVQFK